MGPGEVDRLKEANAAYSKLAMLDRIAHNRVGALSSNRAISLTDTIAGAGAAALGHSPMGAAGMAAGAALANKAGRTFGNPLMAAGANAAAKGVEAAPGLLKAAPQGLLPAVGVASENLGHAPGGLLPARGVAQEKRKK